MDRGLALGALAAGPLLYLWLRMLSGAPPLVALALGLAATWAAMGAALWTRPDRDAVAGLMAARAPGALVTAALALPVLWLGATTMRALGDVALPPHLILAAAIAALVNAALGEAFWRGALIPDATPRAAALALGLYGLAHLGWLGLGGVGTDPAWLLAGALALGGAWTAARLASGALGAGIMGHAGVDLFLGLGIVAREWGPALPQP